MTTSVRFPQPKDPADSGWYVIRFAERLASLGGVQILTTTPDDLYGLGTWHTPGDDAAPTALAASSGQIIASGLGVAVFLTGGAPGATYGVRVSVTTQGGTTLSRTAILNVTGL